MLTEFIGFSNIPSQQIIQFEIIFAYKNVRDFYVSTSKSDKVTQYSGKCFPCLFFKLHTVYINMFFILLTLDAPHILGTTEANFRFILST